MNKLAMALTLMLCISLGFAWSSFIPPSCLSSYSILGVNFTYSVIGQYYSCSIGNATPFGYITTTQTGGLNISSNQYRLSTTSAAGITTATINQPNGNTSGLAIGSALGGANASISCANNTSNKIATVSDEYLLITVTVNSTDVFYKDNVSQNFSCPISSQIILSSYTNGGTPTLIYINITNTTSFTELSISSVANTGVTTLGSHYMSYNTITNRTLRSDFKTGFTYINSTSTSTYGKALLYYSGNTIIPKITYIPGVDAVADFYNGTNNVAYIMNNTVMYVFDSLTNQWYIVPATVLSDTTTIYTIATLFYNAGSVTTSFQLPNLPLQKTCFQNGDQYSIYSLFPSTVSHVVYYDNGTSFLNYNTNAAILNYSVNTSLYPNINYTVNGFDECLRNANTSLFGLSPIGMPSNSYQPITWLLFIGSIGISLAVPFAIVLPVLLNEMFSLMTLDYMAETVVLVGVVSVLLRGSDKNTVKASIVYFLFGIVILAAFFAHSSLPSPDFTGAVGNITTIIQDPTKADIGTFVVGAPNFIVAIFGFVLNLPTLLSNAIFTPLAVISPPIYSFLSSFLTVFIYGAYVYILLVAWEKIANRYQQV